MGKIIAVIGPTGIGKSELSIEIASRFHAEIISGDAFQVYKEMNIGTAKITKAQMQGIKHYLVDCISYQEDYNVKLFQQWGRKAIQTIQEQGKNVVVCGGTGLYIKALLYDYVFVEEAEDEDYKALLTTKTNEELYDLLLEADPKATETIHPHNRKRIIRALMMAHSGMNKSERLENQKHEPIYDAYCLGLTMEREKLYERIDERVLKMIDAGLEQEVLSLVQSQDDFKRQSMRGIGYQEWEEYLYGKQSLEETIALIQKHSRNFAKRQYTWFNNQMDVHWFEREDKQRIFEALEDFMEDHHES